MSRHKRRFGVVPVVLAASALLVTGCDSPSGAPDAKESPAAADSGGPPPGLEAFHAKDCPALTEGEQANGNLISLSHDQPEKGVTVRPGGAPATVLVKLCNTTDRPLTNIALSTQLEWSDAGAEPRAEGGAQGDPRRHLAGGRAGRGQRPPAAHRRRRGPRPGTRCDPGRRVPVPRRRGRPVRRATAHDPRRPR
ncbi:hypothetical protein G3M53_23155 [Streptomyces sp. SID7982]|nr:hypothetical protein [Streptomyces sp. SID7982]